MTDPDFYEDEEYRDGEEEYIFDTYDRIIDDVELDPEMYDPDSEFNPEIQPDDEFGLGMEETDEGLDATTMGMALALADAINETEGKRWDVDEDTDRENWEQIQALATRHNSTDNKPLRPFEQYIDDICKGRRSLFDRD